MQILYEDNHIIAVNKSCSDIVQGDKTGDTPMSEALKLYIKQKYNKPGEVFLGVVHRLDRPTSGAIVFARTSKALTRLNALFKDHNQVKKFYWAVVDKLPEAHEATLTHWLYRNEKQNKTYAYDKEVSGSKLSSLTYRYIASSDRYHLLEIDLHTGRHHQIRAQLAKIGCHIKGDMKYGFPRSNPGGGIHLHARKLELQHPVKKETISLIAEPPNDSIWNNLMSKLL